MKTLTLTDEQYALLVALFESDAMGTDMVQDELGEAASEILGFDEADSDEAIEAGIDLFNSLNDAIFAE